MDFVLFKLLSAAAILGVAIIGGAIPLVVAHLDASRRFFSLGNAFAGGLFLGVGFVHLLPEGIDRLGEVVDYPLGALLAALGLVLLLLIDRVLFANHAPPEAHRTRRSIYPFVLLALLSIHSVIAGISLGLEEHGIDLTLIVVGILAHKGSAAFALMVSSHAAGVERRAQWKMLFAFSLMTPGSVLVGMLLGGALHGDGMVAAFVEGGFNALAAGTFIYIAIVDIIGAEMASKEDQTGEDDLPMPLGNRDALLKFALIVAGIVLIALLGATHGHAH